MPNAWRIGELTGVFMGVSELIFCTAGRAIAKFLLGFGIETLRTLAFVVIVFGNQATTYTNRERQRLGSARPSRPVARRVLGTRCADRLSAGNLGNRHVSFARTRCGRNAAGGSGLCIPLGPCQGSSIQSPQHRIEERLRGLEELSSKGTVPEPKVAPRRSFEPQQETLAQWSGPFGHA